MVSPYSVSVPGGVQAQALGLAREMRRAGHEVRVLAPCDGPPPEPFVTPLGNSLPASDNGSVAPVAPDPSAALRTIRALNDEAFDVVHLHEPLVPGPTATALLLQLAPSVGTFHAAGESSSYRVWNRTARWAVDHLNARVAVSEAARDLAARHLGGEYVVWYNGIETSRYRRDGVCRETTPTVFFCGRYEPRKGLAVLIDAMRSLPAEVRLWVASDGAGIDDLRETTRGDRRIEWLGRVTEDDKIDRLNRCTVFCAPSLGGESFGIVLLEAMVAGAPLVASDIDGYRQVAGEGGEAVLVRPGDSAALASAILRILGDGGLRDRLVSSGRARAERFSMANLANDYLGLYRRLLEAEHASEIVVGRNRLLRLYGRKVLRWPGAAWRPTE